MPISVSRPSHSRQQQSPPRHHRHPSIITLPSPHPPHLTPSSGIKARKALTVLQNDKKLTLQKLTLPRHLIFHISFVGIRPSYSPYCIFPLSVVSCSVSPDCCGCRPKLPVSQASAKLCQLQQKSARSEKGGIASSA